MIEFKQVSKRYLGGFEALSQVNFQLAKREMAFLTGHSGAGKSTMLNLLALLDTPSAGSIIFNGKDLSKLKRKEIANYRLNLGITFQAPHLLHDRNVFANIALPLQIQGVAPHVVRKRVHAALDMVSLLHKEKMLPQYLSGGEQQRVGIARSIVHKPALLLADEPTGNLDLSLSAGIIEIFSQLNQAGVAVLVATHDLPLIAKMQHRIVVLNRGRIS
ncbi:MAG: cell division ATP-binding protein FtsE [Legionellales bacterium RIFCSPHIGHO2_12_FULL_35_11]|nr:MAG: cell division ATP-binding protein FtsE [Legionellales bacterium RIFCSPHIGHO2_12_FULL_35_11]